MHFKATCLHLFFTRSVNGKTGPKMLRSAPLSKGSEYTHCIQDVNDSKWLSFSHPLFFYIHFLHKKSSKSSLLTKSSEAQMLTTCRGVPGCENLILTLCWNINTSFQTWWHYVVPDLTSWSATDAPWAWPQAECQSCNPPARRTESGCRHTQGQSSQALKWKGRDVWGC